MDTGNFVIPSETKIYMKILLMVLENGLTHQTIVKMIIEDF